MAASRQNAAIYPKKFAALFLPSRRYENKKCSPLPDYAKPLAYACQLIAVRLS
jgi:hypothetical protein